MARERRRRERRADGPREVDLFAVLMDDLADRLCALPADAWNTAGHGGGAVASLAERLATLQKVRASQTEEEE